MTAEPEIRKHGALTLLGALLVAVPIARSAVTGAGVGTGVALTLAALAGATIAGVLRVQRRASLRIGDYLGGSFSSVVLLLLLSAVFIDSRLVAGMLGSGVFYGLGAALLAAGSRGLSVIPEPALEPTEAEGQQSSWSLIALGVLVVALPVLILVFLSSRSAHEASRVTPGNDAVPLTLSPVHDSTAVDSAFSLDALFSESDPNAVDHKRRHHAEPGFIPAESLARAEREGAVADLIAQQAFDEAVDLLSDYDLPRAIRLRLYDCGSRRSAEYNPAQRQIAVCSEFVESLYRSEAGAISGIETARDVIRFVVAHEVGHALIAEFGIPVLGREEDAADQFAVMTFITHGRRTPVVSAASALNRSAQSQQVDRWDDHALDAQRSANLICWLYGSDASTFAALASVIPARRRAACEEEQRRLIASWESLLKPHRAPF